MSFTGAPIAPPSASVSSTAAGGEESGSDGYVNVPPGLDRTLASAGSPVLAFKPNIQLLPPADRRLSPAASKAQARGRLRPQGPQPDAPS